MKIINTNLKGKVNLHIMQSVLGQLSDGIWENSPRMRNYWQCVDFQLNSNNEVELVIKYKGLVFQYNVDADVLKWYARKLRQIIKEEKRDLNSNDNSFRWSKTCHKECMYISNYEDENTLGNPTVSQCYNAYEILMKEGK